MRKIKITDQPYILKIKATDVHANVTYINQPPTYTKIYNTTSSGPLG